MRIPAGTTSRKRHFSGTTGGGRFRMGLGVVPGIVFVVLSMAASAPASGGGVSHGVPLASRLTEPAVGTSALALGIGAAPTSICAFGLSTCPAGVGESRVTLTAAPATGPTLFWPDVQVAFVVETTAYDGFYYHYFGYPGRDKCASPPGTNAPVCEESNGGPFFLAHAQEIADSIQQANPHSHVSFALVDFFGTDCGDWNDCGDSEKYHVDVAQFVPADQFGNAVQSTLQSNQFAGGWGGVIGLDDNVLHSPSITAMYGAIIGSGLTWSPNTHHVVVLIGSTAPRDPNYVENYCVSPFDPAYAGPTCFGSTCEPSYVFQEGISPQCEGWVRSQDGNSSHSIAQLARTAPTCTDSIGGVCTIDTIDFWTTPTDPYSPGWPTGTGYPGDGPGGFAVVQDTIHVLLAGCDLATATGGSWDGPAYFTCPNGQAGTLNYVPHGPVFTPNTDNPTLLASLSRIGFGPVYQTLIANGSSRPIFSFVPFGNIVVAPNPEWQTACVTPTGEDRSCQLTPTVLHMNGVETFGWNWSTIPAQNALHVGDLWTASFNVEASGPPYAQVPVDACITSDCHASGSGSVAGLFTSATYLLGSLGSEVVQSFPVARVTVEFTPPYGAPPAPPPPPEVLPPPSLLPTPATVPVLTQIGIANQVGVANFSLNATAAGFLAAGFMRVGLKNKPIALRVAAKSSVVISKFDKEAQAGSSAIGRFE